MNHFKREALLMLLIPIVLTVVAILAAMLVR
jgi:hypothetical protein